MSSVSGGCGGRAKPALCSRCPGRDMEESGYVGSDEDGDGYRPTSGGRRPDMGTSVRWSRVLCEADK
ncbi:HMA domain-containing protein [Psidium guajava]|nr:HMA domain-containing protein [Psidium guajava]